MKKLFAVCLVLTLVLAVGGVAGAKTMKLGLDADPVTLDPHMQLSGGMLQLSHWVFDPLVRWTQAGEFEPRLAEKWERVSDTAMRFYLRKGVKFHSGNEFTAEDVVWTIDRLKTSIDFKGLFEPFDRARVIDKYTVDIVTKKPYALLLNMATYIFPMDRQFYWGVDEAGLYKDAIVKILYDRPTKPWIGDGGNGNENHEVCRQPPPEVKGSHSSGNKKGTKE